MKYKIVADSSANVYERKDVDYRSVPLKIVTSEREYTDVEGTDVTEMVEYLQGYKGRSSTSCPNVHDWLEAFGDADVILGVTITSNLSGSYASAMQAKKDYEGSHPGAHVLIIDSLSAGPELGLIIDKMEEVVKEGLSFEEMSKAVTDYCKQSHLLFALQHMDNLARNGRVNPAIAKIAGVLGIPAAGKASDTGTLQQLHKCRGESASVACIWDEMKRHGYKGGKVRIDHCLNLKMAQSLSDLIKAGYPSANVHIGECTALCSFYAEKGGLMIGYEG